MEFWCWQDSALHGCTAEDVVEITGTGRGRVQVPLCSLTTHLTHDDGIKTWQQDKTMTGFKGDEYRLEMVAQHRCNLMRKNQDFSTVVGYCCGGFNLLYDQPREEIVWSLAVMFFGQ